MKKPKKMERGKKGGVRERAREREREREREKIILCYTGIKI